MNPLSWNYSTWQKFFAVSAAWNLIGAIPALINPRLNLIMFYGFSSDDYYTILLNRGFWASVFIFGIGYIIIAYDPGRSLGIIIMGIIGKIFVAITWFYLFAVDRAEISAVLAGGGDSIFTVFFILYLLRGPRSADNSQ